ncbi:MAG: flagellar biosynthesis protein FlhA [Myxococcaceae bacterium]
MSAVPISAGQQKVPAEALLALVVLGVLAILIVPLPPAMLDGLLAMNVAISVLMLLVSLGLTKPMEFSVFPSLLLITTLFRLSLNVATTRLILLDGGKGVGAAGHVIEAFGRFAVGGSLIVGAVIFLILLVVNFTVITKGSGRVSEVAARFTLDALPGKQMSIDADLAAGVIDDKQARERRQNLARETEFYGAMDGASKFVRGDAIAGLVITAINIVGGLFAGVLRDHLPFGRAVEAYTVLTVGDGLVSQMPALLVSTAAGVLVTRVEGADLGSQVSGQIFGSPRALRYSSYVLMLLALIPGLPAAAFAPLGIGAWFFARRIDQKKALEAKSPRRPAADEKTKGEAKITDLLALDALELEVGYALLPSIDLDKGGEIPGRVTALRKQLASDLGIVLPSVHLRDNLRLEPNEYRVKLRGLEIGKGTAHLGRLMCLEPAGGTPVIDGMPGKDPAFGLPAVWITPEQRAGAEARGYTLVDAPSVLTTHLSELIRKNAHELVGRQEVQELLGACAKEAPKLVEDTVPGSISLGELVRVVRGLLREGISVRDLRSVLEAVADAAPRSKDSHFLIEQVRRRLARQITSRVSEKGVVHALTLDRAAEETLRASLGHNDGEPTLAPELNTARTLISSLEGRAATLAAQGHSAVVLAPADLRRAFFEFAHRFVPDLFVISARELAPGTTIEPAGTISLG